MKSLPFARIALLPLALTVTLSFSCSRDDSGKDELRRNNDDLAAQNAALQSQLQAEQTKSSESAQELAQLQLLPLGIDDLTQQLAGLKSDTAAKEAEIEAQKAEIEALRSSGEASAAESIAALESKIAATESAIAEQKLLVSKLEIASSEKVSELATLFKGSMTPYAGVWFLDPKPELSFPDCQYIVRFDAEQGNVYRALVCADGKIQAERQSVSGFAAKNDGGWNGTMGFSMSAMPRLSSCGQTPSLVASGLGYGFDHSVGTATAANEAALFMTATVGNQKKNFKSGSSMPDLGKNKSCGTIITRSKLASQKDNVLLQQAAKVCQLTPALKGTGCFISADQFEARL